MYELAITSLRNRRHGAALLGLFGALTTLAPAQEPDLGIDRLKLLLSTPVIAATRQSVPIRESAAIVTLLDHADIQASGARDLVELLRMVPGLDFGSDTNGVLGIGVRGNWGHDGKVLLRVDGLDMVEPLYGTNQFGGHYPLGNVERIEVIRGPGSVVYGGFAELAVISVITRRGAMVDGLEGTLWLGRMAGADPAARLGEFTYGKAWGRQEFSLSFSRGQMPEGAGPYPTAGGVVQAGRASLFNQDFLNLGYAFGDLHCRFIRDNYYVSDYTQQWQKGDQAYRFPGYYLGVDYAWSLGDWTFKPEVSLKGQRPWNVTEARTDRNTRGLGRLLATWKALDGLSLTLGGEASQDDVTIIYNARGGLHQDYGYQNRAVLLQALWTLPFGNLDLGLRTDRNSQYPSVTSPRFAFTRAVADWHFKLLAAGAFRAPSMENLLVNPALRPERTTSFEAELGRSLSPHTYASANLFFERMHDPISYANPGPGVAAYQNFDYVGSRGLELDLQTQYPAFSLKATFTYQSTQDSKAEFFRVPGAETYHVGFPRTKATLQGQWRFLPGWSLNPSLLSLGPRYGYAYGQTSPSRLGAATTVACFLTRQLSEAFQAGLKVTNLANTATVYVQPYGFPAQGGNPPLPGPGREVDLRLTFKF
jgi:outer membrane cobalamin receptor